MLLLAVPVSALFLYAALTVSGSMARMADPMAVLDFVSAIVQILGLVCAVVAGVVALWPARERARPGP